ncbi:MAG: hypothetical protein JO257_15265 [Deltaproteobacteria bacterium]|nr:hypothetical protein [Deltaproteobacteria bacterium]
MVLGFAVSAHAEPLDIRVSGHLALHPMAPPAAPTPNLVNTHTLYLNRCVGNCQVHQGNTDSTTHTSDIAGGNVTLTAFNGGDAKWGQIKDCVTQIMAPFNITVTDVDPGTAPHFEVMIAGTAGQLNSQLNGQGILGIADYTCQSPGGCSQPFIPNGLVFDFADDPLFGGSVLEMCGTAAQEIAHAWTLDHATPRSDPMTYNPYTNPLSFQNNVTCGSDCGNYNGCGSCNAFGQPCSGNTHTCMSSGQSTQNEVTIIQNLFGAKNAPLPTVSFKTPANGSAQKQGFTAEVNCTSSDGVAEVDIYVDGALAVALPSAPYTYPTPMALTKGPHHMEAVCGGTGHNSAIAKSDFLIGDPCMTDTDCMTGYICYGNACVAGPMATGGLGSTCKNNSDCQSGECASDGTNSYCVIPCDPAASHCPSGFGCLASNAGGVCWLGLDNGGGGGCCDTGGHNAAGSILLGLGFAATLVTRRKRK